MIQRIQTIYLLISAILVGLLFAFPYAEIVRDGATYLLNFKGVLLDGKLQENGLAIPILIVVILAMHGFAIFSYKTRIKQIRIIIISMFLIMCLSGLFLFFTYYSMSGAQISLKMSMVFPLIAMILDYLAIRAIGKDEALIRSLDRIR